MSIVPLLVAAALGAQAPDAPRTLAVGETVTGDISETDPVETTPKLAGFQGPDTPPTRAKAFLVRVPETGPYHVDLRSDAFDAYLVLRDAEGALLAEDANGWYGPNPRLALFELTKGVDYRVLACSWEGVPGPFELALRAGPAPELTAAQRAALEIGDAERRVRALEVAGAAEDAGAALADALVGLGVARFRNGDYAGAGESWERALAIRERLLGPEHLDTITSVHDLAVALHKQGAHAAARALYERALAVRERDLGAVHADTLATQRSLAFLLEALGDLPAARRLFERALAIVEDEFGPEHLETALCRINLASVLREQGDLARARLLAERALAVREEALGPDHDHTAEAAGVLGDLLQEMGEYAAARRLLERALAIRERTLGPDHPTTGAARNNLALLLREQGDLAAARPLLERALATQETVLGPDHPDVLKSCGNLAALLAQQKDYAAARPLYERMLDGLERTLGPEHPLVGFASNSLGVVLRRQGELAAARSHLERGLALAERFSGPDHPDTATSLNNLAGVLKEMGDLAAARPLYERALAIAEERLGPLHPDTAQSLNNLAVLLKALDEKDAARGLYERSLAIREEVLGPHHDETRAGRVNLALSLADAGEAHAALELVERANRDRDVYLRATLAGMSEGERYLFLARTLRLLEYRITFARAVGEPAARIGAYDAVLGWKGRVGRMLTTSRAELAADADADERALLDDLRRCQGELARTALRADAGDRVAHETRLAELAAERERLERELFRRASAEDDAPVTSADLAARMPPGTALVDLLVHRLYEPGPGAGAWSPSRTTAWITRADREEPVEVDLGPSAAIDAAVKAFLEDLVDRPGVLLAAADRPAMGGSAHALRGRSLAADEGRADPADAIGAALRALVWEPLAPHLDGVDTVFVSPDGALATLPFETLPLADGTRAIERHGFVYVQDPATLLAPERSAVDLGALLSVGGVDFRSRDAWHPAAGAEGAERDGVDREPVELRPVLADAGLRGSFAEAWSPLPATELESRVVCDLHAEAFGADGRRLLLQGSAPSEERLKHELARHAVLHLATHGWFRPEGLPSMWEDARDASGRSTATREIVGKAPGLLSGLVCAGASRASGGKDGSDDGYLTAEEIGWLDLSGVELVVLSACETGLGRAQSGEGLLGLRRAFRTAGARTVISSLWSVQDDSTAALMRELYENLWRAGRGRLEALRAAQLAMLRANRAEHGADLPGTWGAFVLSGEWR